MPSLTVHPQVFEKLPGLQVLVFTFPSDVHYTDSKEDCSKLLADAWTGCRSVISQYANPQSHPRLAAWRQAYTNHLQLPTKKYTTSIENLVRRAVKADSTPRSIAPLVDFYNAVSLQTLVPFGGFDLNDDRVDWGCMELRLTQSDDRFHCLDGESTEALPVNEVAYCCGNTVLTRHINWKQSREGLINADTSNVVLMAEVLGDLEDPNGVAQEVIDCVCRESERLFKVKPTVFIANQETPFIEYK